MPPEDGSPAPAPAAPPAAPAPQPAPAAPAPAPAPAFDHARELERIKAEHARDKTRLAELEAHAPAAQKWAAHEASETARIANLRAALDPSLQAAVDAASTLEGKLAVLAALDVARGTQKPPPGKPPVQGGAPSAPAATDWNDVVNDQAALRAAKARDPVGFANWLATQDGSADRKPTTHELMQAHRAAKAARAKPGV